MANSSSSSGGITFAGMLTIVFIVLKLIGVSKVATWSWWWVLSPLWISTCLVILVVLIVIAVKYWLEVRPKKKKHEASRREFKSNFQRKLDEAIERSEDHRQKKN